MSSFVIAGTFNGDRLRFKESCDQLNVDRLIYNLHRKRATLPRSAKRWDEFSLLLTLSCIYRETEHISVAVFWTTFLNSICCKVNVSNLYDRKQVWLPAAFPLTLLIVNASRSRWPLLMQVRTRHILHTSSCMLKMYLRRQSFTAGLSGWLSVTSTAATGEVLTPWLFLPADFEWEGSGCSLSYASYTW